MTHSEGPVPPETAARTHVGCTRKVNEDAMLARPGDGLWAVADGMGGHQAGDVASRLIVDALDSAGDTADLQAFISEVRGLLEAANTALISLGQRWEPARIMGSTVAVLTVRGTSFTCLWAGDSRIYRIRGGVCEQLTRDHSLVQELVDAAIITPEQAKTHPDGHVVTRALGATSRLDLDTACGDAASGDCFLLATDGLTRVVDDHEFASALALPELGRSADELIDMALSRGAPDNVAVVLVRIP